MNGVIKARFNVQELQSMLFSKVNSEIRIKNLLLDCSKIGTSNPIYAEFPVMVKFLLDPGNCNCEVPLASKKVINEIYCPVKDNTLCKGVFLHRFNIQRTSYGLKDSNDDELADNNSLADPRIDPIKTIRAMAGDELTANYLGTIEDTTNGTANYQYLYAESDFPSASEMEITSASVDIYDASRSVWIRCQNIKSKYLLNDVWKFDLSRAAIIASGCSDPNLFGFNAYEKHDSIKLKVVYKINVNLANAVVENIMQNRLYVSAFADPTNEADKKQCYSKKNKASFIFN